MTDRVRTSALLLAGTLLIVSACLHAIFGWWFVHDIAATQPPNAGLAGILGAGWQLGSASLLAFGLLVVAAGLARRRGQPVAPISIWIVAAVLAGYGAGALLLGDHRYALIYSGYVALAVLLLFGSASGARVKSD
jgi:hypothetical protein